MRLILLSSAAVLAVLSSSCNAPPACSPDDWSCSLPPEGQCALFGCGDDTAQLAVQLDVDGRECRAFDQLLTLRVPAQPGTTPLPECIRPQGSAPGSEVLTSALAALKRSGNKDDAAMQLVEQDDDGYSSIVGGE